MKNITISFASVDELSLEISRHGISDSTQILIQVFMAEVEKGAIKELQHYFGKHFPKSVLIGTTTDGIINQGDVLYKNGRNVITFTSFNKTQLNSTFVSSEDGVISSYKLGKDAATPLINKNTKLLLSFASGLYINGEEFVNGIASIADDVMLAGGMAGDNGELQKTYVFDKNNITYKGAVCVALDSQHLNITTNYTFDWQPIGKKLLVTKAIKNRVYEIDGINATDIYAKYMGQDVAQKLPKIGIEFPLVIEQDGVITGRAVTVKYDDGSLGFAGNIPEGEYIRFGVGAIDEILNNSNYNFQKLFDKIKYKPEAIFIYSCMARRRFLEERAADELKVLSRIGSQSGFFTYGEFFHLNSNNQLFNETMTIVLLSENEEPLDFSFENIKLDYVNHKIQANHVIARLANTVSKELEELNESLEQRIQENAAFILKQAYYDKLTGLPNRLSLIKRLEESAGETIFLVNIDDFTTINDFYGHVVGDRVLQKLAQILLHLVSPWDAEVYKLPSDEFAIVANIEHKQDKIENIIKHIIAAVSKEEFDIDGSLAHVSITMSAAYSNEQRTGFVNADMTLKMAKKSAKQYIIFTEDLQLTKHYEQNIQIANNIKNAIKYGKIVPFFQPIFSLKSGAIEKYEALVRLIKEDGSILSPYSFLGVSEKIKLYPTVTEIMIEKTFDIFGKNGFDFSINLAFTDILNDRTRNFLFEKIDEYKIASQLTIEILETQEFQSNEIISQFILDIYSHGAKIAIDDFGSGFANFKYMTTIQSDYMKIDGSLIRNIVEDENDRLVVETIVSFAQKLGKKTIAEFVHSKEVYEMVKEMGIDYAQGFYLAEPGPAIIKEI